MLLIGLCAHTHVVGNQYAQKQLAMLEQCLDNPASCKGKPLVMRVRINRLPNSHFIAYPKVHGVYQLERPVPLLGNLIELQHGYVIDILGTYTPDGAFTVTRYQGNDWIRPVKYAVSLLGLALAIILFRRRYRFSSSRLLPLIHR